MLLRLPAVLAAILPLLVATAPQQVGRDTPIAKQFAKGAALYYTPAKSGLQSFHCDVTVDFKRIMTETGAPEGAERDAGLAFLDGLKISMDDNIHTIATLKWPDPATIPDEKKQAFNQMQTGLGQAIGGVFQLWNNFATGELTELTDDKTTVEARGAGFHLIAQEGDNLAEEDYGANYRLERFHTHSPSEDVEIKPTFIDTPNGRVVSHMTMTVKQGTGAGVTIDSDFEYAVVNGFRLPSSLVIHVPAAPTISATFHNCTVQRDTPVK